MQVTLEGKKSERATVKQKLGFVPTSVWQLKKDKKLQSLIADDSKYVFDDAVGKRTIPGSGGKIARFSEFNPTVAQACIRIWSKRGDVVLDPFMNRGTIVFVAKYLGRNGIAGEVVKKYYEDTKKRYERFKRRVQNDNWVKLYNWDATQMGKYLERESVDLVLTSPPFWDVEPYESAPGQMADIEDYPTFLFKYYQVIKAAHAVLKPGGYIIYVVNDFRKQGKFYPFHRDTMNLFERAGFALWDVVINRLYTPLVCDAGRMVEQKKITVKSHEYIIVGRKKGWE